MPATGVGIPTWMSYKRNLLVLPTYDLASRHYQHYRIPRPPVAEDAGSTPGMLCWGAAGEMPSAEPLPTAGFVVVEKNTEKSRISEPVRIENPDDKSQYVIADRPKAITFAKMINIPQTAPNTSSEKPAGVNDVGNPAQMKPAGGGASAGGTVTFEYATVPAAP